MSTARVLVEEAQKDLRELTASDHRRVGLDLRTPLLWSPEAFATRNFRCADYVSVRRDEKLEEEVSLVVPLGGR
jgi:hypothetical protein